MRGRKVPAPPAHRRPGKRRFRKNIDDHALDPWRVGRRNQKSRLVQIDANIFAIAEVLAVSCHRIPLSRLPRRKYLSSPYRKKLIFIKGWNTALPPTGSVN